MRILVFAPHNDDEVLGAGGTIKRHVRSGDTVTVCEITSGPRYKLLQEEASHAHKILGVSESVFLNFPVGKLRNLEQSELNGKIADVVSAVGPDVVYVPFIGDIHMDHRETVESAMVALRPMHCKTAKEIYMYETLSETGWNLAQPDRAFIPNVWIDITDTFEDKIRAMNCYESQICEYPHPRSAESIEALAKYRGAAVGVRYAESFALIRLVK
ncbi:MAG: PIG-L family deacetylase [Lachnospiraceae bacterium]|nr:PIG-L family deacetylase [Lachnospiraceae bacterium]